MGCQHLSSVRNLYSCISGTTTHQRWSGLLHRPLSSKLFRIPHQDQYEEDEDEEQVRFYPDTDALEALCHAGRLHEAFHVFSGLCKDGVSPSDHTVCVLLKACHQQKSLPYVKKIQSLLSLHKVQFSCFSGEYLVLTLGKCGALEDAQDAFDKLQHRTVFAWTALISCYTDHGLCREAIMLHHQMIKVGIEPNHYTFVSLLKACGNIPDLQEGKKLHVLLRRKGFESNSFISNTLISMYGKCGSIEEAENVFISLTEHGAVSWNAMLSAYVEQGQGVKALKLYRQLCEEGVNADKQTFLVALQACGILADEEQPTAVDGQSKKVVSAGMADAFHADVRKTSFAMSRYVGNTLVSVYGKCGATKEAEFVFSELIERDVVTWNVMLTAYTELGEEEKAVRLYRQMQEDGVTPARRTFLPILQACGALADKEFPFALEIGRALHAAALNAEFASEVYVGSTLVSMYGKCGNILEAEHVFWGLALPNVVSWNAMLSAYIEQAHGEKALQLYKQMQAEGTVEDERTFTILFQACCIIAEKEESITVHGQLIKAVSLEIGKALHTDARRMGFFSVYLCNSIACMYGRCGSTTEVEAICNAMPLIDTASLNILLTTYVEQGLNGKALQLYNTILKESMRMDEITVICILQACSDMGTLETCRELHFALVYSGYDLRPLLATSLIQAYGSHASMLDAQEVFDALLQPDLVSWNACIAGHAREGNCATSMSILHEMYSGGIKPSRVTFLTLLSACSHAGLVFKGIEYLESMTENFGIPPDSKHYAGIVDLLGRAGEFEMLTYLLKRFPVKADMGIWFALLFVCCAHGNVELGKLAFDNIVSLHPKEAAPYVLMSNMYADAGLENIINEVEEFEGG